MANNKTRILVFSDFDSIRNIIVKALVNKEYNVVEAKTVSEALTQLNGTTFNLVITDNETQNKGAFQIIQEMRDSTSYLFTPIMLLHSSAKEVVQNLYADFNIACYMAKPFDIQSFYSVITRLT